MTTRSVEATVRGVVQGVGFRWFAARAASAARVSGWVQNQPDGSVLVVAEGDVAAIESLLEALREGPPGAWVSDVDVTEMPERGIRGGFEIRAGAHRGD
ncbi:MAG: acylphosphatase [Chloroflexi bacterium]|nr:acylphosphatase [Chloroflexota bacterium]